ncbi:hypothetical protein WJX72_000118 [[Myrmecia] bisecta]|uniref:SGNH hydrolase-type esterase domain-containing protein n=1 Tax=[Myrmecia] bisecta TaxID=41462 RepID=A0AAW1PGQ9_9CHLO
MKPAQHSAGSWLRAYRSYLGIAAGTTLVVIIYLLSGQQSSPSLLAFNSPTGSGDNSTDSAVIQAVVSKYNPPVVAAPRKNADGANHAEWNSIHEQYVQEIDHHRKQGEEVDLIIYGDSITETWRGRQMGQEIEKFSTGPPIWDTHSVTWPFSAATFGIAGDTTEHLLWRIQNGEGPTGLGTKVIIVLIGTNDLTQSLPEEALEAPEATAHVVRQRVVAIVEALQAAVPGVDVIIAGLLPRGDRLAEDAAKLPSKYSWTIREINKSLFRYCAGARHAHFVDCTKPFVVEEEGGSRINTVNMPDILHPAGPGLEELLGCWVPEVKRLLEERKAAEAEAEAIASPDVSGQR